MKNYTQANTLNKQEKHTLNMLISKYKSIKELERDIKAIKEDNSFNVGKIEKYILDNKIDGIKGKDFLVYVRDYTNAPSLKLIVEQASLEKVINKTIASKLMGLYEDNKKTSKRLTVKL